MPSRTSRCLAGLGSSPRGSSEVQVNFPGLWELPSAPPGPLFLLPEDFFQGSVERRLTVAFAVYLVRDHGQVG